MDIVSTRKCFYFILIFLKGGENNFYICCFGCKFICHLVEAGKLFRLSRLHDMLSFQKTRGK